MRYLAVFVLLLAGCQEPPPSVYVSGQATTKPEQQISLGRNAVGEPCTQGSASTGSADVYCGSWEQPSGHVRAAGPANASSLEALATSSAWRTGLSDRYDCQTPRQGTVLGQPALFMDCVRRIGGWPYAAFVTVSAGQAWVADGVLPALPALERSVAVMSGRESASVASNVGLDALMAQRLAARAFSSGDIGQYDALMQAGYRANLADNPVAAAKAYRAALALQEKALGRNNPATADAMASLALQLSLQGDYREADGLFERAARLAPAAADVLLPARILHYRGLHAMNQGRNDEALGLLQRAEVLYSNPSFVPVEAVRPREARFRRDISSTLGGSAAGLANLDARRALTALVEVRRYQAIVLRRLGREQESQEALARAEQLVSRSDSLQSPTLVARLARSEAIAQGLYGNREGSIDALSRSNLAFSRALPGTRPAALVAVMRGGELSRLGRLGDALDSCRSGVKTLTALNSSVEPQQMGGCLDAYGASADRARDPGARQSILAEMFGAAQLAQSGVTSQLILQATARLGENARDPRVAAAIRARETAEAALAEAERRREIALSKPDGAANQEALDKQTELARKTLLDADAALQAASPRYNQLVQPAVSAADVLASLRPNEVFASILLAGDTGWTFLLRDGVIRMSKVPGGGKSADLLVRRIRTAIESTDARTPFDAEAAHALYAATLGSLQGALDGKQSLIVAPSGSLLSIPFGLLLTDATNAADLARAPWVIRRVAVSHVPSAGNFLALRRVATGSRASRPWFGFGDARPVTPAQAARTFPPQCGDSAQLLAGLPVLPGARRELAEAARILQAQAGDELVGPAFTAGAVQRVPLKSYRILHFAAHASLPEELRCQSQPAIITSSPSGAPSADGALLTTADIDRLDLDADLIILSACNSGGPGGTTAGESLAGLARSFFSAGARAMLVTHWEVNDAATTAIIAASLEAMKREQFGVAEAVRRVQLALLDDAARGRGAAYADPRIWAPFAVIGEGAIQPVALESGRRQAGL